MILIIFLLLVLFLMLVFRLAMHLATKNFNNGITGRKAVRRSHDAWNRSRSVRNS